MKRLTALIAFLVLVISLSFGQAPGVGGGEAAGATGQPQGFGASEAAGTTFQAGDQSLITQRIMSSTQYKVTPGDVYVLYITIDTMVSYSLVLQENYDIDVPYMGTINVKGMLFSDLRKTIMNGLKKALPLAQFVSLTIQSPARFDVAVFGGVQTPGIVTVMPLSRVSDAITLAGKSKPGASYRQISLVRGDQKITVDLFRYSKDAASEENPFLEPGDKIFVPQAQMVVDLSGEVNYPGSFELVPGEDLRTLIEYAGGVTPGAHTNSIEIMHFTPGGAPEQKIVDLSGADAGMLLSNGDRVRVPSGVENRRMVLVTGAVYGAPLSAEKPIQIPTAPVSVSIPYSRELTLLSALERLGGPTPYAKAKESLIIRGKTGERVSVDIDALWASRDPAMDIALEPGDTVDIPMVTDVFVAGEVRAPGKLPYNPVYLVSDYIVASGGINPDTANANTLYFVDKNGVKTKTTLMAHVTPGSVILVDRNAFTNMTVNFNQITTVTAFATAIVTFITVVIDFIRIFVP
ncbi:MAG: SLBB domain-containing protein [Spirochaetia bacterium]|jgi:protein involved in polysaccharide export with SLBB domain